MNTGNNDWNRDGRDRRKEAAKIVLKNSGKMILSEVLYQIVIGIITVAVLAVLFLSRR